MDEGSAVAEKSWVGIDVSDERLDVALIPQGIFFQVERTSEGQETIVDRLRSFDVELIGIESTGGIEFTVCEHLALAGLRVALLNPRQVRDYARSTGRLAKNDRIDARMIAMFAKVNQPREWSAPSEVEKQLRMYCVYRSQLVEMRTAAKNEKAAFTRMYGIAAKDIVSEFEETIQLMEAKILRVEAQIKKLLLSVDAWKEKFEILTSMPGVGTITAAYLIAFVPELGTVDRKEIASIVGVAPHCNDSGKRSMPRTCWGGREAPRSSLFMAATSAKKKGSKNVRIREFYEGLIARGKKHKVALVACIRVMLVTLNAMVKTKTKWDPGRFRSTRVDLEQPAPEGSKKTA